MTALDLGPGRLDIASKVGRKVALQLSVATDAGVAVDLSGYTFTGQMHLPGSTAAVVTFGFTTTNAASGIIVVTASAATMTIEANAYNWGVLMSHATKDDFEVAGTWTVQALGTA